MNTPPPFPGLVAIKTSQPVFVPSLDGKTVAETFNITVPAWQDPVTQEIFLTTEAEEMMDRAVTRRLGLFVPEELKSLREFMGLTQAEISTMLQIGERTWTRWESGKERQSRSMNLMIRALCDGPLTPIYLNAIQKELAESKQCLMNLSPASKAASGIAYGNIGDGCTEAYSPDSSIVPCEDLYMEAA